jgi:hypothetical protein
VSYIAINEYDYETFYETMQARAIVTNKGAAVRNLQQTGRLYFDLRLWLNLLNQLSNL